MYAGFAWATALILPFVLASITGEFFPGFLCGMGIGSICLLSLRLPMNQKAFAWMLYVLLLPTLTFVGFAVMMLVWS